jgi:putative endonuclease
MKSYFVYILSCSDDSYYTGSTDSLQKRVDEHRFVKYGGYTKTRLPIELVFSQEFYDEKEAINAERKIKGWSRKKKEALLNGNFKMLPKYSECKNDSYFSNYKK